MAIGLSKDPTSGCDMAIEDCVKIRVGMLLTATDGCRGRMTAGRRDLLMERANAREEVEANIMRGGWWDGVIYMATARDKKVQDELEE